MYEFKTIHLLIFHKDLDEEDEDYCTNSILQWIIELCDYAIHVKNSLMVEWVTKAQ